MNHHDKVRALWLNLELILNALEDAGEEVRTTASCRITGVGACVRWDAENEHWVMEGTG